MGAKREELKVICLASTRAISMEQVFFPNKSQWIEHYKLIWLYYIYISIYFVYSIDLECEVKSKEWPVDADPTDFVTLFSERRVVCVYFVSNYCTASYLPLHKIDSPLFAHFREVSLSIKFDMRAFDLINDIEIEPLCIEKLIYGIALRWEINNRVD